MFRGVPDGDAGVVTAKSTPPVRVVIAEARIPVFINRNKVNSDRSSDGGRRIGPSLGLHGGRARDFRGEVLPELLYVPSWLVEGMSGHRQAQVE